MTSQSATPGASGTPAPTTSPREKLAMGFDIAIQMQRERDEATRKVFEAGLRLGRLVEEFSEAGFVSVDRVAAVMEFLIPSKADQS